MANATAAVSKPAGKSGMPNRRLRPTAAPTNSARSVAIAIASAWSQRPQETGRGKLSRQSSGRFLPLATPVFAERYCTSMAMRFARTMTQTSV